MPGPLIEARELGRMAAFGGVLLAWLVVQVAREQVTRWR